MFNKKSLMYLHISHQNTHKMQNLITNFQDIRNYTVQEIDLAIQSLDSYSRFYIETNDIKKLTKVIELQGILIDARCEKLGIVIPN